MNWEQLIRIPYPSNDFLPTTYSPNQRCEQLVNNSNHPTAPAIPRIGPGNYSQRQMVGFGHGEQLLGLNISPPA
jgi:hypothetical protein